MSLDVILRVPSGMSGNFFLFGKSSYSAFENSYSVIDRWYYYSTKGRGMAMINNLWNPLEPEDKKIMIQAKLNLKSGTEMI